MIKKKKPKLELLSRAMAIRDKVYEEGSAGHYTQEIVDKLKVPKTEHFYYRSKIRQVIALQNLNEEWIKLLEKHLKIK